MKWGWKLGDGVGKGRSYGRKAHQTITSAGEADRLYDLSTPSTGTWIPIHRILALYAALSHSPPEGIQTPANSDPLSSTYAMQCMSKTPPRVSAAQIKRRRKYAVYLEMVNTYLVYLNVLYCTGHDVLDGRNTFAATSYAERDIYIVKWSLGRKVAVSAAAHLRR